MSRDEFEPIVSMQVRPGVFQAWVKLADHQVFDRCLAIAAEVLAKSSEGTADTTSYLGGFTVHGSARESWLTGGCEVSTSRGTGQAQASKHVCGESEREAVVPLPTVAGALLTTLKGLGAPLSTLV